MRRLGSAIAMGASAICFAAESEKQSRTSPNAEVRRVVETKLRRTIIPKVEFKDATIREMLDFLKKKFAEWDVGLVARFDRPGNTADSPPQAISGSASATPPVTEARSEPRIRFKGERVSYFDLPNVICKQAELEWSIERYGILIQPKSSRSKPAGGVK